MKKHLYKIVIFWALWYECDTLSVTLKV